MNTFDKTLRELRNGECLADASAAFTELVKNVRLTGKKGAFTLKLTITPTVKGDSAVITVEDDVKVTPPKEEKKQSVFFATEDNVLQRNDPRQRDLPLVVVTNTVPELKQVAAA